MRFDRNTYFNQVRDMFGGALTQQQVDGQSVILAVWEYQAGGTPMDDIRWLAYMLATVYKECAMRMWPTTEYGAAKAACWLIAQAFARRTGLELVSLRPFTMYGPMEPPGRLVPSVVRHALAGQSIDLTPGDQARDFVYVEDVADAFIAAATTDAAVGGTFNVCTGTAVTVRDIVQRVLAATGSASTARFGALSYRPTELSMLSGDTSRATQILGWRARVSLDEGLDRTIAWFRAVGAGLPEYQLADAASTQ